MIEDDLEDLGRQLRAATSTPASQDWVARARSAAAEPLRVSRPHSRSRVLWRTFVAVMLVVGVMTGPAFFAPRFSMALADAPILGVVARPILEAAGLANVSDDVTALFAVSTSAGYRVELEGGYADGVRTVLLLHVAAVDAGAVAQSVVLANPSAVHLSDQFGSDYRVMGGVGDASTGESALEFAPMTALAAITGARLNMQIDQLTTSSRVLKNQPPSPAPDHSRM